MLTDKTHLPFPEAIDRDDTPDRFTVSSGSESRTDLTHGVMVIDAGGVCDSCGVDHARATRLHEMGHVAFTPADWQKRAERAKDKPPAWVVNAAEDARLIRLRRTHGLDSSPMLLCEKRGEHKSAILNAVRAGSLLSIGGIVSAAYASEDDAPVQIAAEDVAKDLESQGKSAEADAVRRMVSLTRNAVAERIWYTHDKPTFRSSLTLARDLMLIAAQVEEEYAEEKEIKDAEKKTIIKKGKRPSGGRRPSNTWGEMEIVRPPLTRHSPTGMDRKFTAREEGPIPTRFDRWSIDRRIFRMKKRVKGAAVLVDASGSMAWSEEDLQRVLEEVPAATVALYSGMGKGGKLVIVAEKGRRASWAVVKQHIRSGNIIDGPAMEWLSEQPQAIKVWVSDGGFTGPGDSYRDASHYQRMERDIIRFARRGSGIMRLLGTDNLMGVLKGRTRFVPMKSVRHPWQ